MYGYVFQNINGRSHGNTLKIPWYLLNETYTDTHLRDSCGKDSSRKHQRNLVGKRFRTGNVCSAVDKEWEKLEKIPAWDLTKVRGKSEVINEARTKGAKVHFASLGLETNGIAERAVRRVKEGTSAVLLQSGPMNGGRIPWSVTAICEICRILYLMGNHHMKGCSECPLTDE